MEEYKITYIVQKKGRRYSCTRSVDRTLPVFLWGSDALLKAGKPTSIEDVLLERVKKTKKQLKLEVIYKLSE